MDDLISWLSKSFSQQCGLSYKLFLIVSQQWMVLAASQSFFKQWMVLSAVSRNFLSTMDGPTSCLWQSFSQSVKDFISCLSFQSFSTDDDDISFLIVFLNSSVIYWLSYTLSIITGCSTCNISCSLSTADGLFPLFLIASLTTVWMAINSSLSHIIFLSTLWMVYIKLLCYNLYLNIVG